MEGLNVVKLGNKESHREPYNDEVGKEIVTYLKEHHDQIPVAKIGIDINFVYINHVKSKTYLVEYHGVECYEDFHTFAPLKAINEMMKKYNITPEYYIF